MTSEHWDIVKNLFHAALAIPHENRASFLRQACQVDAVRLEAERLLTEHGRAAGFLEGSAATPLSAFAAASGNGSGFPPSDESRLFAGRTVGPYCLVRLLGLGGMGTVWLAVRTDGILKRPVAIKLPHSGFHGRQLMERLNRERDILANLSHPHIARLYDAGITAEGEPYLALEYIEGIDLLAYCDSKQLSVRERLNLFLQVLSAVHYANSHLVIHRDVKPSNILVTNNGEVKLLDFGVAKLLLDSAEAEKHELTQVSGRIMTPNYASPEQVGGQPISTASDVYSLGVVLCELLTGARPYMGKIDSRSSLEEAILTGRIARPSQKVQDASMARARASNVKNLAAAIRGDLETIILKALTRQPNQRYASADAFAQDIELYLNGWPVLAQSEGAGYRLLKFAFSRTCFHDRPAVRPNIGHSVAQFFDKVLKIKAQLLASSLH